MLVQGAHAVVLYAHTVVATAAAAAAAGAALPLRQEWEAVVVASAVHDGVHAWQAGAVSQSRAAIGVQLHNVGCLDNSAAAGAAAASGDVEHLSSQRVLPYAGTQVDPAGQGSAGGRSGSRRQSGRWGVGTAAATWEGQHVRRPAKVPVPSSRVQAGLTCWPALPPAPLQCRYQKRRRPAAAPSGRCRERQQAGATASRKAAKAAVKQGHRGQQQAQAILQYIPFIITEQGKAEHMHAHART